MILRVILVLMLCLLARAAPAAGVDDDAYDSGEQAFNKAVHLAIGGPAKAGLGTEADVRLDPGLILLPRQASEHFLRITHHPIPDGFLGLLLGEDGMATIGIVSFVPAGFVEADAIQRWRDRDLLFSLNVALRPINEERQKNHLLLVHARHWSAPPRYVAAEQQLSWAALYLPDNAPPLSDGQIIYRALKFGRDGYIRLSFDTSEAKLQTAQDIANRFMTGVQFQDGKRYQDATATDPRAQGGLPRIMDMDAFQRAPRRSRIHVGDLIMPLTGTCVATVGGISLFIYTSRRQRRRRRRIRRV